jgi:hypothetical protein
MEMIPHSDVKQSGPDLAALEAAVQRALAAYAAHVNHGGMTPAEVTAFDLEDLALHALARAAITRRDAAVEMEALLEGEADALHDFMNSDGGAES